MRQLVYIACPLTLGDRDLNFACACAAQRTLMREGYAPINPGLTVKLPGCWEIPHATWVECSLPLVAAADAVLRLPGESVGADAEVAYAESHGIPVFYSIEELQEAMPCEK
jgi:hypothetical protein